MKKIFVTADLKGTPETYWRSRKEYIRFTDTYVSSPALRDLLSGVPCIVTSSESIVVRIAPPCMVAIFEIEDDESFREYMQAVDDVHKDQMIDDLVSECEFTTEWYE